MLRGIGAFALRVLLYAANIFLVVSFVLFATNYHETTLGYYSTSRTYRITFLVYLIVLILLGAVCCRKSKLPLAVYRLYLAVLILAVVFSAIFIVFDLDQTETVKNQLKDDIDHFNKFNQSFARLDELQSKWKCCGYHNVQDYNETNIPASCERHNTTDGLRGKRWERPIFINDEDQTGSDLNARDEGINSIFIPNLGRIRLDKYYESKGMKALVETKDEGGNNGDGKEDGDGKEEEDQEPKEYYPLGCLTKLEEAHMRQRAITVKLLITVGSSSFAAIVIIFILIFIKKE